MKDSQYTLRLTLESPHGKSFSVAMPIDAFVAQDRYVDLSPPDPFLMEVGAVAMDRLVERIRKREYRKDDFERAAQRLARSLGERMEDEEGWHGIERQDRYEQRRREGKF